MSPETAADHIVQVLGRVPLFQGLPRTDLERIAALTTPRELKAGEFLFREGDPGDRFHIVDQGAVEILKERPLGDHDRLDVKRAGDAFGGLSLLRNLARSVSVRAIEDTRLLAVGRADFQKLLGGETIAVRLLSGLAPSLSSRKARFGPGTAGGETATFQTFGRLVLSGLEPEEPPQVEGFRVAGGIARDEGGAGGALWDAFTTDDGRTLLSIMDVEGTGLPPAYLIAITRAILHEVGPEEPFDRLLRRLNAAIFRNLFDGLDECVEAALIEIAGGRLRWACAGDQPGVVLRADGRVEETPSHGPPLGILPQFDYDTTEMDLQAGDTLLAFSDAPKGLVNGVVEMVRGRTEAEPAELAHLLQTALRKVQTRGAETDVAFVVVKKR